MITLSNNSFKPHIQSLRSTIGNINVESKIAEPNQTRIQKFCQKFLNSMGNCLAIGFRDATAKNVPLSEVYYPMDFIRTWERFISMPVAMDYIKKIDAFVEFKDRTVVFETLKFAAFSEQSKTWFKNKGVKFIEINTNTELKTTKQELTKITTMVRGRVFDGVKKNDALASIHLYRSNQVRPNWGTQSQTLFATLGSMCVKCGNPAMRTCDHVMPRSKRMDLSTSLVNMQPLCQPCNNEKASDFVDYRTDLQRKAMLIAHFKYTVKTISDTKALIMYLEYGFTRRQIARELKISDAEVNTILGRHAPYLEKMASHIETRRVYRRAYEELNSNVVTA